LLSIYASGTPGIRRGHAADAARAPALPVPDQQRLVRGTKPAVLGPQHFERIPFIDNEARNEFFGLALHRGYEPSAHHRRRALIPSTDGLELREQPVVWFSANQDFEQTTRSWARGSDGWSRSLTMTEMARLPGGLVRLGIPEAAALPWSKLRREGAIGRQTVHDLTSNVAMLGADLGEWYGVVGPIDIDDIVAVQTMDTAGIWIDGTSMWRRMPRGQSLRGPRLKIEVHRTAAQQ
jgi:hypothetical protein